MIATRYVGEIALRVACAVVFFYLAAFFEVTLWRALAMQIGNGSRLSGAEILAYPAVAAIALGLIILAALPLRGTARGVQLAMLAVAALMMAYIAREFWQREEGLSLLEALVFAGVAACGSYIGWTVMQTPIKSPRNLAAIGGVLIAAGVGLGVLLRG